LNPKERLIYKEDQTEMAINERVGEDTPYDALIKEADLDIAQIPNVSMEKNIDVRPFISWNGKRWIIKEEELGKLAVKLERKYDVKIIFENERLKHLRFSGTLEDESIEQVFKAVSLVSPVRYKIEGKNVFLQYNSQFMSVYGRAYKE
jgi:transmembrane sensor